MPKMIVIADGRSGVYAPEQAADYIRRKYGSELEPELQDIVDVLLTLSVEAEGYWQAFDSLHGERLPDGGLVTTAEGGDVVAIYAGPAEQNAPPDAWDCQWEW